MASQISLGNTNPQNGGGIASTAAGADSLTNQLAGMSKHQLYQIVSQMKDLIHQNQQQARQILIANPQLTKTLFQAQVMLGMVRAPETSPPASALTRSPQQTPTGSQGPEVPPIPPPQSTAVLQPPPNQQPAPQQAPPQMTSPYLQQSQASSAAVQPNQPAFVFQQSVQPQQQTGPLTNMTTHSQPLATSTLQPPLQHGASQPLLPLHPPPLPQQPRPLAPLPQMHHPNTQGVGYASHPVPQSYQPQSQYLSMLQQQQGGPPQTNAGPPFQQMLAPPLPTQPSPQQMFQVPPRSGNVNIGSSGIVPIGGALDTGRGLNMGIPSTSAPLNTWNQALPSSLPMGAPHVTPAGAIGHMVAGGHHPFGGTPGSNPNPSSNQVFNQAMVQPQPPQQQLPHQQQMPIELEQQKALLQQVMNLTPEQINSLPPEQRQQVLQLQQAFRSQTGGG